MFRRFLKTTLASLLLTAIIQAQGVVGLHWVHTWGGSGGRCSNKERLREHLRFRILPLTFQSPLFLRGALDDHPRALMVFSCFD